MTQDPTLRIDAARFWSTVMRSGEIGPGKAGGLRRLALTDADKEMRDLFVAWCTETGCTVAVDRIGNVFARRPGTDDHLPPVLIGSHLDTQMAGGKYDGIYYMSRIAPTAMIFTPCRDGISHNEAEHADRDTTVPGVNVLLHAVLARANRSPR